MADNNCLSCFYSRIDKETHRLVCCNMDSHNLWEYVDRICLCDHYEMIFQPTILMEVTEVEIMSDKAECSNCGYGCSLVAEGKTGVICRNEMSRYKGLFMDKDSLCNFWVSEKAKDAKGEDKAAENIDHPERYTKNNMECIEEMVEMFGIDAVMDFCKCNVWKYRYRATCEDDMKKADWYMDKFVSLKKIKECEKNFRRVKKEYPNATKRVSCDG